MPAVDVAVIGGGVVGVATAAHLAAVGATVRLYERDAIAAAASGRNSGAIQHPFDPVLVALYEESLGLYRRLADEDAAFTLAPRPAGLLYVGARPDRLARLAGVLATTHPELDPTFLDEVSVRDLEPSIAPGVSACRVAMGYPVGPREATEAYARHAARLGADIVVGATTRPVIVDGRATGIEHDGRVEAAGAVVVAAGPWTPDLVDPTGGWRPIRSLWGVVASIELARPPGHILEEAEIDIEPQANADVAVSLDAGGGALDFSLMTAAGSSSLGSTFLPERPDPEAYRERLVASGARFVPEVAEARVHGLRSCARPLSFDGRPLLGAVPGVDGLWVAAGHGPWGISTGPASGRIVADLVLGRKAAGPTPLDPARYVPSVAARRLEAS